MRLMVGRRILENQDWDQNSVPLSEMLRLESMNNCCAIERDQFQLCGRKKLSGDHERVRVLKCSAARRTPPRSLLTLAIPLPPLKHGSSSQPDLSEQKRRRHAWLDRPHATGNTSSLALALPHHIYIHINGLKDSEHFNAPTGRERVPSRH